MESRVRCVGDSSSIELGVDELVRDSGAGETESRSGDIDQKQ